MKVYFKGRVSNLYLFWNICFLCRNLIFSNLWGEYCELKPTICIHPAADFNTYNNTCYFTFETLYFLHSQGTELTNKQKIASIIVFSLLCYTKIYFILLVCLPVFFVLNKNLDLDFLLYVIAFLLNTITFFLTISFSFFFYIQLTAHTRPTLC